MLVDISSFYILTYDISHKLFKTLNIDINSNTNGFDLFLEWCINECLITHYNVAILKHYKVDEFKVIFTSLSPCIEQLFISHVASTQLSDYVSNINNTQFRTVVNARDLFIMKRYNL